MVFFSELGPVSVGPEINFPTTDWCGQNTHNCARTAHHRTQCTSTVTRTRVAPGRTAQDCALWWTSKIPSSQRHVSHVAALVTEHFYTISFTFFNYFSMFFYGFVFRNWIKKPCEIHSGVADIPSLRLTQKVNCSRNAMESAREVPFG